MDANRYHTLRMHLLLAAHRDPDRSLRFLERVERLAVRKQSFGLERLVGNLREALLSEVRYARIGSNSRQQVV